MRVLPETLSLPTNSHVPHSNPHHRPSPRRSPGAAGRALERPRPAADAAARHHHRSPVTRIRFPFRPRSRRRASATSPSTATSTRKPGRRRRPSPSSPRSTRRKGSRARSAPTCASSTTPKRCTSARACTRRTAEGHRHASRPSRRRHGVRLLRGRDRRVPRSPRPRLLRRQSVRREVRRARRRHVESRRIVGRHLGGARRRSTRSAGPPSCAFRTRSSASRAQEVQTWGLQVRRYMQRSHEYTQWSHWKKTEVGGPSRFGHLEGIRIGSVPKHLELLPYAVTRSRHIRPDAPGDPFNDGSRQDMRFGGDVKALLTSNLTLDATINPDFGQVEVDPATVNLSAFETFFEEKRPFFVAGSGIFNFGNASCYFCSNFSSIESFYSRRIGRAPQGAGLAYDAGQYADVPENSTILGAAKITGRTSSGDHARAAERRDAPRDGERRRRGRHAARSRRSSRSSNYFVGRATKDYHDGNLVVGGIAHVGGPAARRPRAARSAHVARRGASAPTWCCTWDKKNYQLLASAMLSNVAGDSAAMMRVQRSSAHYFQRPDRAVGDEGWFRSGFLERVVPARRDRSARAGDLSPSRQGRRHLQLGGAGERPHAGLRGQRHQLPLPRRLRAARRQRRLQLDEARRGWYRDAVFIAGAQQSQNFDGDLTNRDVHVFRRFGHAAVLAVERLGAAQLPGVRRSTDARRPGRRAAHRATSSPGTSAPTRVARSSSTSIRAISATAKAASSPR